jgi:hypothetical protein
MAIIRLLWVKPPDVLQGLEVRSTKVPCSAA